MAKLLYVLLVVIALNYGDAAPSDISKIEDITRIENEESEKKPLSLLDDVKGHGNAKQAKRHKRMYDYFVGGGHPPMNPAAYPSYGPPYGGYGPTLDDPLGQIYKKLQDIATEVRRQSDGPPPPPPAIPVYFPVIYIPQVGCSCTPSQPSPPRKNGTSPDINTRFPAMEDSRQNWGIVDPVDVNNNQNGDDDYVRPLSFEPLRPNRPSGKSPPPVDHGSTEGDTQSQTQSQFQTPLPPFLTAASSSSSATSNSVSEPTSCDAAVFVCCDKYKEKYSGCFVANGCSDVVQSGNNCDEMVIENVIAKYQRYYGQRKG